MPSDFMALDMGYPNLKGLDTEKKLQTMEDYLMQLLEQLRYTLHNLSTGNFNRAALEAFASSISTPVSIALKKEIDRAEGAEGQLRTDIGIVAGEVRSEVTRATGAEAEIRSEIVQTADDVMLRVVGGYANEWTDGRRYYESDAVKVTTVTDGKVTAVAFYKAKQEHTAAAANKPPSAAYWDIVASPSVQSIIDLNLDGITLEYDNSGVSDKNAAFIKLSKDGVQIAGRKVIMTNVEADTLTANAVNAIRLDASQINAGTLSADRIGANSIHLGKLGSDVTGSFGEDNPDYIQGTYIDFRLVSSPAVYAGDFYGGKYHDADGDSTLDIESFPGFTALMYGPNTMQSLADATLGAYEFGNNHVGHFYIGGVKILTAGGSQSQATQTQNLWDFSSKGMAVMYGTDAPATYFSNHGLTPAAGQVYFKI